MNTPNRSPTHREIELARLPGLGLELEELAEDGPLTATRIAELAEEQGKPPSHYYAAVALATELTLPTAPITAVFCAGKCQSWGALECLDAAAELHDRRGGGFAIDVRACLDRCADAPVVELRTPDGTAVLTRTRGAEVAEAISTALGVAP